MRRYRNGQTLGQQAIKIRALKADGTNLSIDRVDALKRLLESENQEGALELLDLRVSTSQSELAEASIASQRRYDTLMANFKADA